MENVEEKLTEVENCIKLGHFSLAKKRMDRIALSSVGRPQALKASNLARRCGRVEKSLKILNPIVRNRFVEPPASEIEKADYAFSLHRMGATFEADNILKDLNHQEAPSGLFFRSLIAFSRWDYLSPEPWLKSYCESSSITEYQRLMGLSNLVNVYLYTSRLGKALDLIDEIREKASRQGLNLLQNLCSEQKAEYLIMSENFEEAHKHLQGLQRRSKDSGKLLQLWVWKLSEIVKARFDRPEDGLLRLERCRQEAIAQRAWEVAREMDYYKVLFFKDERSLQGLYYGTPYSFYRKRLEQIPDIAIGSHYVHRISESQQEHEVIINPATQTLHVGGRCQLLELSGSFYQLIHCLLTDLYRPKTWGEIFHQLFPDEYFDPFHSINRLHQVIFRFNKEMQDRSLPLKIRSHKNLSFFDSSANLGFVVPETHDTPVIPMQLLKMKRDPRFAESFSIQDILASMGGAKRSQQRFVKDMVEQGFLKKMGQGKSIRYKIA